MKYGFPGVQNCHGNFWSSQEIILTNKKNVNPNSKYNQISIHADNQLILVQHITKHPLIALQTYYEVSSITFMKGDKTIS
jgi:hypothetical protein